MASKFVPKFAARQEEGRLIVKDSYRFKKYITTLGDKELDLIVTLHRDERSNPQNRYYRGVIIKMISEKTGHDEEEIHAMLANRFLEVEVEVSHGVFMSRVRSTTELNTVEMNEYMKKCRDWAWDFLGNYYIPEPNEVVID